MANLSIVIPTYNEKDNILNLIEKINKELKDNSIRGEIIFIDDNSPDKTGEFLESLKKDYKFIKIIHRKGKLGLSSAVIEGFKIAKSPILCVMDADLSHPPEKIYELYNSIKNNEADLAIGSRYIQGGDIVGWKLHRKILSKGATLLSKIYTQIKDPMSGFFAIKKSTIENLSLNSKGFKILLEIIIKANCKKIKEIPITFTNRKGGKSKASFKEVSSYLRNLLGYLPYKKSLLVEFIKFGLVGLIGVIINLGILYILTEYLGVHYLLSAFIGTSLAVTNNFLLNKVWTFKEKMNHEFLGKYSRFASISIITIILNLILLYFLTEIARVYYITSQFISIVVVSAINFLGNKAWTFKK